MNALAQKLPTAKTNIFLWLAYAIFITGAIAFYFFQSNSFPYSFALFIPLLIHVILHKKYFALFPAYGGFWFDFIFTYKELGSYPLDLNRSINLFIWIVTAILSISAFFYYYKNDRKLSILFLLVGSFFAVFIVSLFVVFRHGYT